MAYCKSCGAYIPDGGGACLACGYDEAAKAKTSQKPGGSAAASQKQSDDMRQLLEKHRRQQQEQARRWAEQEQARRKQQEQNQQWAEEEYARRQEEKERQAQQYVNRPASARPESAASSQGNKALACLSYLGALCALPYFLTPQDRFARYHAKQGLKLLLFGIAADVLGGLTGVGWILSLFRFYLMYKGISAASQGRMEPLPYIGDLGENN